MHQFASHCKFACHASSQDPFLLQICTYIYLYIVTPKPTKAKSQANLNQVPPYTNAGQENKIARCTASAAAATLAVAALIICGHARTGDAQAWAAGCNLSDIRVSSERTGRTVAGQPEYRVAVENRCACPQNGVRVRCAGGLPSAEPVDDGKIRAEDGGVCLVNDGMMIARGSPVVFTYAWRTPQEFAPAMAVSRCGYPPSSSSSSPPSRD